MIKVTLSELERHRLEDTFKTTPERRLRNRCHALLMAARGRCHHHIAADLGISPRTLPRWLHAYQAHGVGGLTMQWAAGAPARIPEVLAAEIRSWISAGPAGCGLDRANWTSAAWATQLSRTKGMGVSQRTMRACGRASTAVQEDARVHTDAAPPTQPLLHRGDPGSQVGKALVDLGSKVGKTRLHLVPPRFPQRAVPSPSTPGNP